MFSTQTVAAGFPVLWRELFNAVHCSCVGRGWWRRGASLLLAQPGPPYHQHHGLITSRGTDALSHYSIYGTLCGTLSYSLSISLSVFIPHLLSLSLFLVNTRIIPVTLTTRPPPKKKTPSLLVQMLAL